MYRKEKFGTVKVQYIGGLLTWSTDAGVAVECRPTELTLRSCRVVSTRTNRRVRVAIAGVVVVTETASTRRKRSAERRRRPRVAGCTLLAELALQCTRSLNE